MTELELKAKIDWQRWGAYARHGQCDDCQQRAYTRAKSARGPYLCLACFDQK